MPAEAANPLLRLASLLLRVLLGLALLALGIGIAVALFRTREVPPTRPPVATSLTVGTVPVTTKDLPRQWTGYGTARAMDAVDLAAQVGARVIERPDRIEPGAQVSAGDLIVKLEQVDYLARSRAAEELIGEAAANLAALDIDEASWREQLRLAEEQADIERRELQQARDAFERGASTSSELDRRTKSLRILEVAVSSVRQKIDRLPAERASLRATLARLQADAARAAEDLERTTITTPISGVVQRVDVEQGELLAVGAPVARIVSLSRIEVPLRIPASALGYVRVGDSVSLRPDGPNTKHWQGTVARIAPEAEQTTRTLTVFVEVLQDAGGFELADVERTLLLPGEFVMGAIAGAPERGRVVVPRRAVRDGSLFLAEPNGDGVWIARRIPVDILFYATGAFPEIDPIERQWAVLESPLPADASIIVTNLDDLTDGRYIDQQRRSPTAGDTP